MKEIDDVVSLVPADEDDVTADYQTNAETGGFFYKTSLVPIHSWQLWENPKHSLRRSSSARSINSPHHRRRLASITSIPEADKPKVTPPTPPPLLVDPYAPDPNVIRVERIRDDSTGRDVYVRWLKTPTEVIPPSPIPIYDFQMKNDMIDRLKKEVQIGLDRLVLEEEAKKAKKKKKKKKHHKHHKHSKSYREEYISTPVFTPIQPAYSPVPFEPQFFQISAPSPAPSAPFWFYSM